MIFQTITEKCQNNFAFYFTEMDLYNYLCFIRMTLLEIKILFYEYRNNSFS